MLVRVTLSIWLSWAVLAGGALALGRTLPGGVIAFSSDRNGGWDIYLIDVGRGDPVVNLTRRATVMGLFPAWSPDGRQIAFVQRFAGIYVMNANGSNQRKLTEGPYDWSPAWSPDGKRIAFVSERQGNRAIYVMNADGSNQRRLSNIAHDLALSWSPDGESLAFMRGGNIYVLTLDKDELERLTQGNALETTPSWSPDGGRIAFVSNRDGNPEIYTMSADGSDVQRLTYNESWDTAPSWSPDGSQIVFVSDRDGNPEIYVMDADGGHQRRLTYSQSSDINPTWWPGWR